VYHNLFNFFIRYIFLYQQYRLSSVKGHSIYLPEMPVWWWKHQNIPWQHHWQFDLSLASAPTYETDSSGEAEPRGLFVCARPSVPSNSDSYSSDSDPAWLPSDQSLDITSRSFDEPGVLQENSIQEDTSLPNISTASFTVTYSIIPEGDRLRMRGGK